ncbi:tail fiber assembly protein [Pantoea anthophila]|uniref:tail fiber assembly protein n=1 Tax=Pantoea anthophila TaxID=470931 RepID=UPI000AEC7353|nr:tail fiber assembly protein [Pantoea anthophila]
MLNFGPFKKYTPDIPAINESSTDEEKEQAAKIQSLTDMNIIFVRCKSGQDWYESQALFSPDTMKIVYDEAGRIVSFDMDVSKLWPINCWVAEVDASDIPEGMDRLGGWAYRNGKVRAYEHTAAELQEMAERTRSSLLTKARAYTSDWQAELALGLLPDTDKAQLVEWMAYIRQLKETDIGSVPESAWPAPPAAL